MQVPMFMLETGTNKHPLDKVSSRTFSSKEASIFNGLLEQKKQIVGEDKQTLIADAFLQQLFNGEVVNDHVTVALSALLNSKEENATHELLIELKSILKQYGWSDEQIGSLLEQNNSDQQIGVEKESVSLVDQQSFIPVISKLDNHPQVAQKTEAQFNHLFGKIEQLLAQFSRRDENITKLSGKVLQILNEWTAFEKKFTAEQNLQFKSLLNENTKENTLLRELLVAFKKRNAFVANHHYRANAQVTSNDIAKWIHTFTLNRPALNKTEVTKGGSSTPFVTPMSDVEQFIIHVSKGERGVLPDQQMMKQFQQAVRSSNFLAFNNGTNQLLFSLRPQNLGDMVVKLTQINGEMTVKILVSSQVAKEMLESNMHQLKNMFSPHQVVVEKEELTVGDKQSAAREADKEQMKQSYQQEDADSEQSKDQDDQSNKDFKTELLEHVLNEKV